VASLLLSWIIVVSKSETLQGQTKLANRLFPLPPSFYQIISVAIALLRYSRRYNLLWTNITVCNNLHYQEKAATTMMAIIMIIIILAKMKSLASYC
jgi:hypothetical protein